MFSKKSLVYECAIGGSANALQGVYTNSALQLGKLLDSTAFRAWSTILAVGIVILWLANTVKTVAELLVSLRRRRRH